MGSRDDIVIRMSPRRYSNMLKAFNSSIRLFENLVRNNYHLWEKTKDDYYLQNVANYSFYAIKLLNILSFIVGEDNILERRYTMTRYLTKSTDPNER